MAAARQRTRLEPALRRVQILQAAARIFREEEYSAVSLDAVAEAAGVTRGLLHHYFGSKRGLYLEVIQQAVRVPDEVRLMPEDTTGDLSEVLQTCVDIWMRMIKASGGLWSGSAPTGGFATSDVDIVITRARDELVERMIEELPFPDTLDTDLLRSALRAYSSLARVACEEWLVNESLTWDQTATLLHSALMAIVESVVPRMMEA